MFEMKITILLTILPAICLPNFQCGQSSSCTQGFVINGRPTCSLEFPWHAALIQPSPILDHGDQLEPFCGATIISRKFLISAAHCFLYSRGDPQPNPWDYQVYTEFDDRSVSNPIYHFIKRIEIHQDWLDNPKEFDKGNDIALLELLDPLDFSDTISPICLPSAGQEYLKENRANVKMAGFGSIKHFQNKQPTLLQKGEFQIINCGAENNICADEVENGRVISSTCRGDSGGGLVGEDDGSYFLIGVVSWGRQCGAVNFTTRYVDMFKHLDWINNRICLTDKGNLCRLPFQFRRREHTKCLSEQGSKTFKSRCPTAVDSRGQGIRFETCSSQCPGYIQPVDGNYGPWGPWSQCSKSCQGGRSTRSRTCDSPAPKYGGKNCAEDDEEERDCNIHDCPIINESFVINNADTECPAVEERCFNVEWLKSNNQCSDLVKMYDDINNGDLSESETIFSKTCNFIPYGLCCVSTLATAGSTASPFTFPNIKTSTATPMTTTTSNKQNMTCVRAGCCKAAERSACNGEFCFCQESWYQDGSSWDQDGCNTGNCAYDCLWCSSTKTITTSTTTPVTTTASHKGNLTCVRAGCCLSAKRSACDGEFCFCQESWYQDGSSWNQDGCNTGNCAYDCLWCSSTKTITTSTAAPGWLCEKERNCATDENNVSQPACNTDSKEDNWEDANSLEKCQTWAEKECNASIVVFWSGNWCNGYMENCPYGEEDYPFGNVDFCKKTDGITTSPSITTEAMEDKKEVVIIAGGCCSVDKVEIWSPDGSCNGNLPSLPKPRADHIMEVLQDGSILICGEVSGDDGFQDDCITFKNGAWTHHSNLRTTLYRGQSVHMPSAIYVINLYSIQFLEEGSKVWKNGPSFSPQYPNTQGACAVKVSDTTILVTGGTDNNDAEVPTGNKVMLLDITSNTWTQLPDMPQSRFYHGCLHIVDDERDIVLLAGGSNDDASPSPTNFGPLFTGDLLDLKTMQWKTTSEYTHKHGFIANLVEVNNRYFLMSGDKNVDEYHPQTESWSSSMVTKNAPQSSAFVVVESKYISACNTGKLTDDFAIIAGLGGQDKNIEWNPLDWEDKELGFPPPPRPPTNTWDVLFSQQCSLPTFPMAVEDAIATATDNTILVCGGEDKNSEILMSCHQLRNGVWSPAASMLEARAHAAAVNIQDGWLVSGGRDNTGKYLDTMEMYRDGNWVKMRSKLPEAATGHCIVAINDTTLFVTGGYIKHHSGTGYTYSYQANMFNMETGEWTRKADMKDDRAFHECFLMGDKVVVAGGFWSVEVFDLKTELWQNERNLPIIESSGGSVNVGEDVMVIGAGNDGDKILRFMWIDGELQVTRPIEKNFTLKDGRDGGVFLKVNKKILNCN